MTNIKLEFFKISICNIPFLQEFFEQRNRGDVVKIDN